MKGKQSKKNKNRIIKESLYDIDSPPSTSPQTSVGDTEFDGQVSSLLLPTSSPPSLGSAKLLNLYPSTIGGALTTTMADHMIPIESVSQDPKQVTANTEHVPEASFNVAELYNKISEMMERGLALTAEKITNDIRADFHCLGNRIDSIEHN